MVLTSKQIERFWSKVKRTSGCWLWSNALSIGGYGKLSLNSKVYYAHKISAFLAGKLLSPLKSEVGAKGEIIMHTCDNRKCVNPLHLIIATQKENIQDAKKKGRRADISGEKNPNAKVSALDVKLIKTLVNNLKNKDIADMFNLKPTQVYSIASGRTWRNT